MTRIAAARNNLIDIAPTEWRLNNGETPLMVATRGGLRFGKNFARTRRLSDEGALGRDAIMQVVAGWQQRDESWHLGLIVTPSLAEERGSRWCELAAWPDPDQEQYLDLVKEAGRGLSTVLGLPFHVVPPKAPEQAPPPPLPDLPISSGLWTLEPVKLGESSKKGAPVQPGQLVLVRSSQWTRQKLMRSLWYFFWLIVYVILSVATITSEIALPNAGTLLPNPEILPYLGLATAVLLGVLVIGNVIHVLVAIKAIVIDPTSRSISAYAGKTLKWQKAVPDVQSVYVSEMVKKKSNDPTVEHGEINLHLGGGNFFHVMQQGQAETNDTAPRATNKPQRQADAIMPLSRDMLHTYLQSMGLHIAEALQTPCWYDMRVK